MSHSIRRFVVERFKVGVVGSGYVGLVKGACLAQIGHQVTCIDKDPSLVAELAGGQMPFYELGLESLMAKNADQLRFTTELAPVVRGADVIFIAVGTPQSADGSADLSSVAAVARDIGWTLAETSSVRERPLIVVNKSTVPVGSGDYVSMLIEEGASDSTFHSSWARKR